MKNKLKNMQEYKREPKNTGKEPKNMQEYSQKPKNKNK